MEVKLVIRTLQLFEVFAREAGPLSLTELSRRLEVPMSSMLALVRTLAARGYLYETRKRGGYYPTRRMLLLCRTIDTADPLLDAVRPVLESLRDTTQETVVLGRRQDLDVVYLDVCPSRQAIRYDVAAGEMRPLASNSIGKALFSVLDAAEQKALAARLPLKRLTAKTITSGKRLIEDAALVTARGWAANQGESVVDLGAYAMPFHVAGEWYGVSVVGPLDRIERHRERHLAALRKAVERLAEVVGTTAADAID